MGEGQVSNFGKDLMNHELLTADDEFSLARQYKIAVQISEQRKLLELENGRRVSNDEIGAIFKIPGSKVRALSSEGNNAKTRLVQANMRLVFHISKYYRCRGVAYPDLVHEGTFGLMKAIDKYDPDRGFRFSTYASWWIKQAVSRAIAEKSRIVRLPVHIHDLMSSVNRAEAQFAAIHSRKPTTVELAERLALPVQKVELLMKCSRDVQSMDADLYTNKAKGSGSGREIQVKDRLMSGITAPTEINERKSIRSELRRAMSILSEREAQIVEMRFGLSERNPMTLEDIGKEFGVTRERIRQIEARALAKMRNPLHSDELRDSFPDPSSMLYSSMSTMSEEEPSFAEASYLQ